VTLVTAANHEIDIEAPLKDPDEGEKAWSKSRSPPTATTRPWSGRSGACPWTWSPRTGQESRSMSKISAPAYEALAANVRAAL